MTQFDLDKLDEGTWFAFRESRIDDKTGDVLFDDPKKDAGRVCLRQAGIDALANIEKETGGKLKKEFVLNPKTRQMERVEYREQTTEEKIRDRQMLWDHVIVNWEGFKDKNGNDIPVTIENKMKLMNISVFARFVTNCLNILDGQKEVTEKN